MSSFSKFNKLLSLGILAFTLASCATSQPYSIDTSPSHKYIFADLPRTNVQIIVNDLRSNVAMNGQLRSALETQLNSALSDIKDPNNTKKFLVTVDILELKSTFYLAQWVAKAHIHTKFTDQAGNIVYEWDSVGSSQQASTWGIGSEKLALQEAYNIAIADLINKLSHLSIRNNSL